jgi:hypothetical protein
MIQISKYISLTEIDRTKLLKSYGNNLGITRTDIGDYIIKYIKYKEELLVFYNLYKTNALSLKINDTSNVVFIDYVIKTNNKNMLSYIFEVMSDSLQNYSYGGKPNIFECFKNNKFFNDIYSDYKSKNKKDDLIESIAVSENNNVTDNTNNKEECIGVVSQIVDEPNNQLSPKDDLNEKTNDTNNLVDLKQDSDDDNEQTQYSTDTLTDPIKIDTTDTKTDSNSKLKIYATAGFSAVVVCALLFMFWYYLQNRKKRKNIKLNINKTISE